MPPVKLELQGMAYGGEAFARLPDDRMAFVAFGLPGERVQIEIAEEHTRWVRGRIVEIDQAHPARIAPRCRHYQTCGGCHYQHLPYELQLHHKQMIVVDQLRRLAGISEPPVKPTIPSPDPWNYRNHLQFQLTPQGKVGYVTHSRDRVFAIEECPLAEPALADLWPRLDIYPGFSADRLALRSGLEDSRMLVLRAGGFPRDAITLDLPLAVVWLGPGGAAVLSGEGHLWQQVRGRHFRVSAGSFFQANRRGAEILIDLVLAALNLKAGDLVYDLYAGVGLFSAFMAAQNCRLAAVESATWACADFEVNLREFDQVSLYEAPVELALQALTERPQAVVVDPPRSGLSRQVVDRLTDLAPPRLVYASCDPATLARDIRGFIARGYQLEEVIPLDMFPQTFHIEMVSVLTRTA
jgi:23S rRNA (uracil1939-C5)-methyltransferase